MPVGLVSPHENIKRMKHSCGVEALPGGHTGVHRREGFFAARETSCSEARARVSTMKYL